MYTDVYVYVPKYVSSSPPGQNVTESFLREVSKAISQQITNWPKLVSYLALSHSDLAEVRVQCGSGSAEELCLQLLRRWRERHREGRDRLKMRLLGAGVDFDAMLNSMPGGQVQGVEHRIIGMYNNLFGYEPDHIHMYASCDMLVCISCDSLRMSKGIM